MASKIFKVETVVVIVLIVILLNIINLDNNIFYHIFINLFTITVAIRVFNGTWNFRKINDNRIKEIEEREKKLKSSEEHLGVVFKKSKISLLRFDKNLKPLPLFNNESDCNKIETSNSLMSSYKGREKLNLMMKEAIVKCKNNREVIEIKINRETMIYDVTVELSLDQNNVISSVIVTTRDITENKKIETALNNKLQAIESIYNIATSFNYKNDSIYEKICESIALLLEAPVVSIGKIQNNHIVENVNYINGEYEHCDDEMNCNICKIMVSARTAVQISGDMLPLLPDKKNITIGNVRSFLGIPVFNRKEELTGIISVLNTKEQKYKDEQIKIMEIFARYILNEIEKETFVKELLQSREMALLGQLTSGVAHEVRNPLNAIWAITEALFVDFKGDKNNLIYKEHIHAQVKRLSRLMQDLLDLGKPHVFNDSFSIKELCEETIRLWSCNNANISNTIILDFDNSQSSFLVTGDSTKMQQVIMNLLDNASEHSPKGSAITISIRNSGNQFLIIKVTDTGRGISNEISNRIFEPFFTTRKGGTGLGLSIVKRIIENHNGTISIYNNNPPPGVTVKIRLPISDNLKKDNEKYVNSVDAKLTYNNN